MLTLSILLCQYSNAQESFKKKYFISNKLANGIKLKKDIIVTFDNENDKEKDEILKKYEGIEYVDVVTEELIDGKKVTVTLHVKIDEAFKNCMDNNH